jgi:hypothetical protein
MMVLGCSPQPAAQRVMTMDKIYSVTPDALTVKAGMLSGAVTGMKITEQVEEGSGKVTTPARLTGKLVLKNVSPDHSVRLLGGKIVYIDTQGKPIALENNRTAPLLRVATQYGSPDRLDPGQDASHPVEAEFPVEALKAKRLKEILVELSYIPSLYREETLHYTVSIGGQDPAGK